LFGCKYNVRETGFIDLGNSYYSLYFYINGETSEVVKILKDYHQSGGTVIMATHRDDTDNIADRIILLNEGEIKC